MHEEPKVFYYTNKQIPERKVLLFVIVVLFVLLQIVVIFISVGVLLEDTRVSSSETLECPPTGHWCVSQEDTAVSFCRTRGFEFSPRTPRKRALRDTEGVTKIRSALFDHNSSVNSLLFYLWGCTPDPKMPKASTK